MAHRPGQRPPDPARHPQPAPTGAQRLVAAAVAQFQAGQIAAAAETARTALTRGAADADSLRAIASILGAAGLHEQSLYTFERALRARPDDPYTLEEYGKRLASVGKHEAATAALGRSIELQPRVGPPLLMLLSLLIAAGREDDLARIVALTLGRARTWTEAMTTIRAVWLVGSNIGTLQRLARLEQVAGPHPAISMGRPQPTLYLDGLAEEDVLRAHKDAGEALAKVFPAWTAPLPNTLDTDRPLRVGYVSQDFRDRSAGHFIEGIITGHNHERFTPYCYHHTIGEDALTARLKAAAVWRDIRPMDDEAVARQVQADRIDILVDLTGHTGMGRLAPFALRPAPVQVSYMGYPHTTGLPTMDARIVDTHTDPPGAERFATERLIRLDPCFLCYTPPTHAPHVATRAGRSTGIVFGSFNAAVKLTDRVLRLWARIVRDVPGSTLLLKASSLETQAAAEQVARAFAAESVDPARCTLRGETKGLDDHLSAYAGMDIALDPFPYNGTTTTLEALWMGVPVVALAGDCHRGRVGVSLLSNVGLADLVATSEDEYVRLAIALAGDAPRLAALRESSRPTLAASPICDRCGSVARLEAAYRSLWVGFCATEQARRANTPQQD